MKMTIRKTTLAILTVMTGLALFLNTAWAKDKKGHSDIANQLIELTKDENHPEIRTMLDKSLEKAKSLNPCPITNPAQNWEDYLDYIDTAHRLIPQQIIDVPAVLIRDQILQSICYFYFLVDQPLAELEGKGYFNNSIQYYPPFSDWLHKFADSWGDYLDTDDSWNSTTFRQFYDDPLFGLQIGWYENPDNWNTFNDFFSKHLRTTCERPIGCPDDPSIVISPADSEPQGVWQIDDKSRINFGEGLTVKLARYYNVNDLLSEDSKYKDAFANGKLTHTFLNVFDYHRFHFAVGGEVVEMDRITKNVSLEVSWSDEEKKYIPIDSEGWQFAQTRGYVIVDTKQYGLVTLIPMGMAQVSSVNFETDDETKVEVGSTYEKGAPLGYFLFGGSDFIMLFQEKAGFEIMAQQNEDRKTYKHNLMGVKYGVMRGNK